MKNQNLKKEQAARAAKTVKLIEAYLVKNQSGTASEISKSIGVAFIQVHQIAQKMVAEGKLSMKNKMLSLVESPVVKKDLAKQAVPRIVAKETQDTKNNSVTKNFGRDFSKLTFNGEELRKGKWVLAVMKQFVLDNPKITLPELDSMFPKSLVRSFGLYEDSTKARKINQKGRQRYFQRMDQVIELADGNKISVTNQISKENLPGIIAAFQAAGAKVQ